MPDIYITRLREALDLRLKQGYTKAQIARAGDITADDITQILDREDLNGVSAIDLDALMRALFVDDGYVFEGTARVKYSLCSFQRLLIRHYGKPEGSTAEAAPIGVEERFIPTWEQLEELWMNQMSHTSFVEKHEYELGFQTFKLRHEGR